jgi:hypothetical protein
MAGNHDIEKLGLQHQKMLELALSGLRVCDIARELSLAENSVSRIMAAPTFQDALARRRREQQLRIDEALATNTALLKERTVLAGIKAVDCLENLLTKEAPAIQLDSAKAILAHAFRDDVAGPKGPAVAVQINVAGLQAALEASNAERARPADIVDIVPEGQV